MKVRVTKYGLFDWETGTVKFGGELSNPKNIFTAQAIKVPDYKYMVKEREDAGNGWYGSSIEIVEKTADKVFVILRDGVCIGYMDRPYAQGSKEKSPLFPITKNERNPITKFLHDHLIPVQYWEEKSKFTICEECRRNEDNLEKDPVNTLLVTALMHLTDEQKKSLADGIYERLPNEINKPPNP